MGVYLPKPKTEKESEDGGDSDTDTRFGLAAMQGWRQYMEDAHLANPSFDLQQFPSAAVFGVFDGHGGPAVSAWVASVFPDLFRAELQTAREAITTNAVVPKKKGLSNDVASVCEALQQTFLKLDETMKSPENRQELKLLHQEAEKKKQIEAEEDSEEDAGRRPESLLDAIVSGVGGSRPIIRVIEQDGQKFYQLVSRDLSADDDEDSEDKAARVEDLEAKTEESPAAGLHDDQTEKPSEIEGKESSDKESSDKESSDKESLDKESSDHEPQAAASTPDEKVAPEVAAESLVTDAAPPMTATTEGKESKRKVVDLGAAEPSETADAKEEAFESAEVVEDENELFGIQPYHPECCGTTAIVATVVECDGISYLVTANAGDSRAVLCRDGKAMPLSVDHKPGLLEETRRILRAGGRVVNGRVDGNLNLSRSLGDLLYKDDSSLRPEEQKIIAYPDVRITRLTPTDEFVIIACDGIWDCLTNEDAVDVVQRKLAEGPESKPLSKICEEICDLCLSEHPLESEGGIGCDNMTIMIVIFNPKLRSRAKDIQADLIFYGEEPENEEATIQEKNHPFFDYSVAYSQENS